MRALKIASVVVTVCVGILFAIVLAFEQLSVEGQLPQIEMESDTITVSVLDNEQALLAGVTAYDAEDGNLTDKVMVETISNFITEWEREITVVVFDADNQFTKATRTIIYQDYTAAQFTLTAPLRFAQGVSSASFLTNLSVTDCLDGDLTATITQYTEDGSTVDTAVQGEYQITFAVSNSAGAVEKFTATVEIYDTTLESTAPQIYLSEALLYLEAGQSFDPLDFLTGLTYENTYYQMTEDGQLYTAQNIKTLEAATLATETLAALADAEAAQTEETESEAVDTDALLKAQEAAAEIAPFDLTDLTIVNPVDTSTAGWYEVEYRLTDASLNSKVVRLIVCVRE